MTARATLARDSAGGAELVIFRCPGCDDNHRISVGTWTFNGDLERPTFSPSVLVSGVQWDEGSGFRKPSHAGVAPGAPIVCHSYVTDGRIQFLGDCTHVLAGQTVDLPEWSA
ncbi:MAG TPA: DUF6527 family protein [Nocardioides sp.]|uniref:DUF6527 family protein n=1 Tax=Nocardioides sp. TaxID=35761 RepID=UPI002ED7D78D